MLGTRPKIPYNYFLLTSAKIDHIISLVASSSSAIFLFILVSRVLVRCIFSFSRFSRRFCSALSFNNDPLTFAITRSIRLSISFGRTSESIAGVTGSVDFVTVAVVGIGSGPARIKAVTISVTRLSFEIEGPASRRAVASASAARATEGDDKGDVAAAPVTKSC